MAKTAKKNRVPIKPLKAAKLPKARKAPKQRKPVKPAKTTKSTKTAVKPASAAIATNGATPMVLDRLWQVVLSRRNADPAVSHSARLLSRGTAKVAQKFGEEAVECLIEAVAENREALIGESADVLYHLLVLWVAAGLRPEEVWDELERREGISGIAEKASRARTLPRAFGLTTRKIP